MKRHMRRDHLRAPVVVIMIAIACGQNLAHAQAISEYRVKAAYLYSFARFIEWPSQSFANAAAPLKFCIMNDQAVEYELNQIAGNKRVDGRRVEVLSVQSSDEVEDCHLLFINSSQSKRAQHILDNLRHKTVVTVGDSKGFVEQGGIIDFALQDNRVQFRVNHRAANEAGVQISARLLSVAKMVIE